MTRDITCARLFYYRDDITCAKSQKKKADHGKGFVNTIALRYLTFWSNLKVNNNNGWSIFILVPIYTNNVICLDVIKVKLVTIVEGDLKVPFSIATTLRYKRRRPRGVMVKAMDCEIVVREFVLQLCYYVHFWANTLGKGMNPLMLPAMG